MNLRPTKCEMTELLTFFPRSHNILSATHFRHSESSSSSSSASGSAPAPVSAPAAVPIMTGPPILAVVHDKDVPAANLPADDSSDEDEAAVNNEVVLAAGDFRFDAGPLVLDRNIPEQDEVHRVLGLIQIHLSRDVQNTIIDNCVACCASRPTLQLLGRRMILTGSASIGRPTWTLQPFSTGRSTRSSSFGATSSPTWPVQCLIPIVVEMFLIEMLDFFNYQMHNPYHNPIRFLYQLQYPMHTNNNGPWPNSWNTHYFPHMLHLGNDNARGANQQFELRENFPPPRPVSRKNSPISAHGEQYFLVHRKRDPEPQTEFLPQGRIGVSNLWVPQIAASLSVPVVLFHPLGPLTNILAISIFADELSAIILEPVHDRFLLEGAIRDWF